MVQPKVTIKLKLKLKVMIQMIVAKAAAPVAGRFVRASYGAALALF